jgi:hypothetical protein
MGIEFRFNLNVGKESSSGWICMDDFLTRLVLKNSVESFFNPNMSPLTRLLMFSRFFV